MVHPFVPSLNRALSMPGKHGQLPNQTSFASFVGRHYLGGVGAASESWFSAGTVYAQPARFSRATPY